MGSDKRILVTGAAGFIGSHLCDNLVGRGAQVIALDDLSTGKRRNLEQAQASGRLRFVEGSVLDQPLIESLCAEVDVVYHLAVACLRECFERPQHVHAVNASATLLLLEAARARCPALERFIYVSSSEVYGTARIAPMAEDHPLEPTTTYGASKLAGEHYARAYQTMYQMPVTVVRPFNTYGPREHHEGASGEVIPRFTVRIVNDLPPLIFGDGEQTRDFTYVLDTAEGLARIGENAGTAGQVLNLARGQEVSIRRIADLLLQSLGKPQLIPEYRAERPADVARHLGDIQRLQERLDYRPPTDIETGISHYVEWFLKTQGAPEKLLAEVQDQNW